MFLKVAWAVPNFQNENNFFLESLIIYEFNKQLLTDKKSKAFKSYPINPWKFILKKLVKEFYEFQKFYLKF